MAVSVEGPAVGLHLRSLVGDADSADVDLLAADAACRGESGEWLFSMARSASQLVGSETASVLSPEPEM